MLLMAKGKIVAALLLAAAAAGGGAALSDPRTTVPPSAERCRALERAAGRSGASPAPQVARIVATVNGEPILAEEVYATAYLALPGASDLAAHECVRRIGRIWGEMLDRVVEREVILQGARAALKARAPGLLGKVQEAGAREFDRGWARDAGKRAGLSGEGLEASLGTSGTSLAAVRRQWQRDFVAREYLRSRLAGVLDSDPAGGEAVRRAREQLVARLKREAVIEYPGR